MVKMEENKKLNEFADTSKEAYELIKPTLTEREQRILDIIDELDAPNCEDIATYMGKLPHEISGRFTKLKEKKKIFVVSQKKNARNYNTDCFERLK